MARPPLPLAALADITKARLTLGRQLGGQSTASLQAFRLDHAAARQAVWHPLDTGAVAQQLAALGYENRLVHSAVADRTQYLRRPDLGRRLAPAERQAVVALSSGADVSVILADGLSALAIERRAVPLVATLVPRLAAEGLTIAPLVVATNARVALGDEIGELLGARLVIMLIGERPGLSSPDSLGVYLTFGPRVGLPDSRRNCISNIHDDGLSPVAAAARTIVLAMRMIAAGTSGVALAAGPEPAIGEDN